MAKRATTIIVNVCKHCHEVIDLVLDETSGPGFWEAMGVGGSIGELVVTKVEPIIVRNSSYLGYVVELDTRKAPHCDAAKHANSH